MRGADRRTEDLFRRCGLRTSRAGWSSTAFDRADHGWASAAPGGEVRQRRAGNLAALDRAEKLLRALLLPAFTSVRSERQLMERLGFDWWFRPSCSPDLVLAGLDDAPAGGSWFVGPGLDDPVRDVAVFTRHALGRHRGNRDRLLEGEVAARFLRALLKQPSVEALLSGDRFPVDGMSIEIQDGLLTFVFAVPDRSLLRSMGVHEVLSA